MNRTLPIVLAVALFMEQMDSTVIATSLPAIALDLGTSPIALKLALTTYLVSLAIFIPISGWMADRFGAKKVFRIAILVFVCGSLGCAAAGSIGAFVAARFIQGMGGAMMTPIARLVLVRSTPKSNLVSAMAWLTIPGLLGPIVGPPVGGFVTTYFSWHWIFLINLPIGIAGVLIAGRVLPEFPPVPRLAIDWTGFLYSGVAASGIVFGLSVVSMPALPPSVGIATTLVGIAAGALYIRHAFRHPNPILDLRLFAIPTLRAGVMGGSLFRISVGAIPFLLPLMFQIGFGLNPFESGLLTFSSAIGALGMKFIVTRALKAMGFKVMLIASSLAGGLLIGTHALFTPQTPYLLIIATLIVAGFMRSMFFTAANALVFVDVGDQQVSQTTALTAVTQQISLATGVALAGMVLEMTARISGGLGLTSFWTAFIVVAILAASSCLVFLRLPADAGTAVSGHKGKSGSGGQTS